MFKKGTLKKYGSSILITLGILIAIFIIGPVAAIVTGISMPASAVAGDTITFTATIDLETADPPFNGQTTFTFGLGSAAPTVGTCTYDAAGNEIGGTACAFIACDLTRQGQNYGYGYGYGYGYSYEYGYGYPSGEFQYSCQIPTVCSEVADSLAVTMTTTTPASTTSGSTTLLANPAGCAPTPLIEGGGNHNWYELNAGCCSAVRQEEEWICCDTVTTTAIQCCAQPDHVSCVNSRACTFIGCRDPYVLDQKTGECVKGTVQDVFAIPPAETKLEQAITQVQPKKAAPAATSQLAPTQQEAPRMEEPGKALAVLAKIGTAAGVLIAVVLIGGVGYVSGTSLMASILRRKEYTLVDVTKLEKIRNL